MVIRRFDVPRTLPATISMGLIAIGLLFPVDQPFYQPIDLAGFFHVRQVSGLLEDVNGNA
jgi:hypothetical protein